MYVSLSSSVSAARDMLPDDPFPGSLLSKLIALRSPYVPPHRPSARFCRRLSRGSPRRAASGEKVRTRYSAL